MALQHSKLVAFFLSFAVSAFADISQIDGIDLSTLSERDGISLSSLSELDGQTLASGGQTYAEMISDDGAVAHWALDESSGDLIDLIGSADLTVSGATYGGSGPFASAGSLSFDGVDDYAQINGETFGINDGHMTVEYWIKLPADASGVAVGMATSDSNSYYQTTGVNGDGYAGTVSRVGGTLEARGSTAIDDGTWYHVVAVWDASGDDRAIFVDGVEEDDELSAGFPSNILTNTTFAIARLPRSSPISYIQAEISHVAVYDFALGATEIAAHAAYTD